LISLLDLVLPTFGYFVVDDFDYILFVKAFKDFVTVYIYFQDLSF